VQAGERPALTEEELATLAASARRPDAHGTQPPAAEAPAWAPLAEIPRGATVAAVDADGAFTGWLYRAETGGVTGAEPPAWPAVPGAWATDGTVVWRCEGRRWSPTFALYHAVAEGWEMKAGKAAYLFDASAGDVEAKRDQVHQHCMRMALHYRGLSLRGVDDGGGTFQTSGTVTNGGGSGLGVIAVRPGFGEER